jgi:hypothetical protein
VLKKAGFSASNAIADQLTKLLKRRRRLSHVRTTFPTLRNKRIEQRIFIELLPASTCQT